MKRTLYISFIFFLLISNSLFAQEIVFKASVSKNPVALNEQFQLSFEIQNVSPQNFRAPTLSGFSIASGPNQSSSYQFVNGKSSQSITYSYILRPQKVGTFKIAPATFQSNGKTLQSNALSIKVVQGSVPKQQNTGSNTSKQSNENLFIRAILSKSNVYQGEQLTLTYKLYIKANVVSGQVSKLPNFSGFWQTDLTADGQPVTKSEVYNGKNYKVAVIKKLALFPQHSGEIAIDPMEMEIIIRQQAQRRRRSIFDDFFGSYKDVKNIVKSKKVKIKVKPLPSRNKPKDFSGLVGNFNMKSSLNSLTTKSNEPITLKVKIYGKGNIKMLTTPTLNLPKDFEAYDPKIAESIPKRANPVSGSKSFDYLIVPRRQGEFKFPPVTFSYFDISKKDYVTLSSEEYTVLVEKGDNVQSTNTVTGISKEDVDLLGEDIRYIKTGRLNSTAVGVSFFKSDLFYLFSLLPMLLFAIFFFFYKKREDEKGNVGLQKSRRANKLAKKKLKQAEQYLKENNQKDFYDEVVKALWGYLGDKLNVSQSELTKDNVRKLLNEKEVEPSDIDNLLQLIDECEMALYAPNIEAADMAKKYEQAIELILNLESKLK